MEFHLKNARDKVIYYHAAMKVNFVQMVTRFNRVKYYVR